MKFIKYLIVISSFFIIYGCDKTEDKPSTQETTANTPKAVKKPTQAEIIKQAMENREPPPEPAPASEESEALREAEWTASVKRMEKSLENRNRTEIVLIKKDGSQSVQYIEHETKSEENNK